MLKNNRKGFDKLLSWVNKLKVKDVEVRFVMEATGVYHEGLACYLVDKGHKVSVILPNRAKAFSKTLTTKTVTDMTASESLAVMGLEKQLDDWQKPGEQINHLKQLNREREQLIQERSMIKNQLTCRTTQCMAGGKKPQSDEGSNKVYQQANKAG